MAFDKTNYPHPHILLRLLKVNWLKQDKTNYRDALECRKVSSTRTTTGHLQGLLLHYLQNIITLLVWGTLHTAVQWEPYLEHVLHVVVNLSEGGSPPVVPVPALPHEAVHARWAAGRALHAVARLQQLKQGCVKTSSDQIIWSNDERQKGV